MTRHMRFGDLGSGPRTLRSRLFRDLRFVLTIVLSSALAFLAADIYGSHKSAGLENGLRLNA